MAQVFVHWVAPTHAAKRNLQMAHVERRRSTPCELIGHPSLWMLRLRMGNAQALPVLCHEQNLCAHRSIRPESRSQVAQMTEVIATDAG